MTCSPSPASYWEFAGLVLGAEHTHAHRRSEDEGDEPLSAATPLVQEVRPSTPLAFDPFSSTHWDDPYPMYRRLREEAPVYWAETSRVYCVSRYHDVESVFRNTEQFSSQGAFNVAFEALSPRIGPREVFEMLRFLWRARLNPFQLQQSLIDKNLIAQDAPLHSKMRGIVNRGFTPRRVRDWEPRVREIAASLLADRPDPMNFDVVRDLAIPLPVAIIAEVLGIGPERHADLKRWSVELATVASGSQRGSTIGPLLATLGELSAYLRGLVAERKAHPSDDLVSVLIDPAHGDTLDAESLFSFVVLLILAGNETTTNLIGSAVSLLLDHPEALELVVAEPARIPALIEEALRFDPPVHLMFRRAKQDLEIAGARVPREGRVGLLIGAANRDDRQFVDPDRFDITRDPTPHLAFGQGAHFCLGASLARLEARTALELLIPELPRLARATPARHLVDSTLLRGLSSLPLTAKA
jgi:cytochrome P450